MSKLKTRTKFTVEGSGAFPFDMLRYDACWPSSEFDDSPAIGMTRDAGDDYFKLRRVTLLSDNHQVPTDARWRACGWKVIAIETYKVAA